MTDVPTAYRLGAALRRRLWGHPIATWLVWGVVVVTLAMVPMGLADPALWPYLLDPELMVVLVVVALRYSRRELDVLRLRLRARRTASGSGGISAGAGRRR